METKQNFAAVLLEDGVEIQKLTVNAAVAPISVSNIGIRFFIISAKFVTTQLCPRNNHAHI